MSAVSDGEPVDSGGSAFENRSELKSQYAQIIARGDVAWTVRYRLLERLGSGGQGVVYLAEREGAHELTLRAALKVFSPERYRDGSHYQEDMQRIARVAMRVAEIQQDHLLDVHNFVHCDGVQVMVMEWIDGFDLRQLLSLDLEVFREVMTADRWEYLTDVIVTMGPDHLRLKPGIAIAVLRDCLAGLAAMHRLDIVHSDIKPSNIMLKCTGHAKLIDLGSAFELNRVPERATWTPRYASPEVLTGRSVCQHADLASLGYVLLEMLSGRSIFAGASGFAGLARRKQELVNRFPELLPQELQDHSELIELVGCLIAPAPLESEPSAEAAESIDQHAARIQRQLVLSDLASDYEGEIRGWLHEVRQMRDDGQLTLKAGSSQSFMIQTSGIDLISDSDSTVSFEF